VLLWIFDQGVENCEIFAHGIFFKEKGGKFSESKKSEEDAL
jgi:hypothetical protein